MALKALPPSLHPGLQGTSAHGTEAQFLGDWDPFPLGAAGNEAGLNFEGQESGRGGEVGMTRGTARLYTQNRSLAHKLPRIV